MSGGGSNLRALLEAATATDYPARVVAVGSDRPDAGALDVAAEFGIPTFTVALEDFDSRTAWGDELLGQIEQWQPGLTVLSGFMRLLPPQVVGALAPNLVNTHPAYLPEFPGAHGVRDALAAGASETGASLIVVDNGVDSGPVISQERVPVLPGDTEATLHDRIKPVERRLLIDAVRAIAVGSLNLKEVARP